MSRFSTLKSFDQKLDPCEKCLSKVANLRYCQGCTAVRNTNHRISGEHLHAYCAKCGFSVACLHTADFVDPEAEKEKEVKDECSTEQLPPKEVWNNRDKI